MATSSEAAVLLLFHKENKPFSVQNLVDLLAHAGHKKPSIIKALDSLQASSKILCKEFGKTKIYMPSQSGHSVLSKEEMDQKQAETRTNQATLQAEREAIKKLEQELSNFRTTATLEEMKSEITANTSKLIELDEKLVGLKSGAVLVSAEERTQVAKEFMVNVGHWRKRRTIFRSIWSSISESMDRKDAEVFEEMGIDTDESVGADLRAMDGLVAGASPALGAKRRKL